MKVKIAMVPGRMVTVEVNAGTSVADIANLAGMELEATIVPWVMSFILLAFHLLTQWAWKLRTRNDEEVQW